MAILFLFSAPETFPGGAGAGSGAGRAFMYANPGARERAFNLRNLFRGAQFRTLLLL